MNQHTPTIEAAADALLRIVVPLERQRFAARSRKPAGAAPSGAAPFVWRDPHMIPTRDALNLPALASDPVGTACRAELRRIGHALRAARPDEDFIEIQVEIAEMDPTHADWRVSVLETVWAGIDLAPPRPSTLPAA